MLRSKSLISLAALALALPLGLLSPGPTPPAQGASAPDASSGTFSSPRQLQPLTGLASNSDYVSRSGAGFSYRGQEYRFIGVNLRGLAHRNGSEIRFQLEQASAMHARVMRIFIAKNDASTETIKARLRSIIDIARGVNSELKFIVVLTDFYSDSGLWVSGDAGFYNRNAGGYNVLNHEWFRSGFRQNYKPLVEALVREFKSTPEIFAWELGNELQAASANDMLGFAYEMGNFIKGLGANQMVTTGFISSHHAAGGNYSGRSLGDVIDDFYRDWAGKTTPISFVSIHGYNNDWAPGKPNQVEADRSWAAGRMPYVMGEIGFSGGFSGTVYCTVFGGEWWDGVWLPETSSSRGTAVQRAVDHFLDLGADGVMQWGFMAGQMHDNGEGDACFGMDQGKFHRDWDDLFNYYSAAASRIGDGQPPPPTPSPPSSGSLTGGRVLAHDGVTAVSPPANTQRNDSPVQPGQTRQAEHYWGLKGIDFAGTRAGACPANANSTYLAGWHQGDLGEYRVEFPSASRTYRLTVVGMPDDPKPVQVDIYLDGNKVGQIQWDDGDPRCNEGEGRNSLKIQLSGYQGVHAVAFVFANDYCDCEGVYSEQRDRNFWFDYFKFEEVGSPPPPSSTAPLQIKNASGGVWAGLWITHCLGDGTQRVWQASSDVRWADYRGIEAQKDCGSRGALGIYPLVFRDSTVAAGTWVTWCTGSNQDQWVWRSNGSWKYVPFQYPEKNSGCP